MHALQCGEETRLCGVEELGKIHVGKHDSGSVVVPHKNVNSAWIKKLAWPSQNVKIHIKKYHSPWGRDFLNTTLNGIDWKRDNLTKLKIRAFVN